MPDDGDKTEQPTPHRRMEARRKGQVSRSQDLGAAVLLLSALVTLDVLGRDVFTRLMGVTQLCLSGNGDPMLKGSDMVSLTHLLSGELVAVVLPFMLCLFLVAGGVLLLQIGFLFTMEPVRPDLNKINPLSGLKRIFSMHAIATSGINMAKLSIVGVVVYMTILGDLEKILLCSALSFTEMIGLGVEIFLTLGIRVAIALIILGLIDWMYQRYRQERGMRMSKQEVKDEMKRMDGDPVMKRRRREAQLKLAMQNIRRDVPQADVVVTNPTHFAIALRYDTATMTAPKVVAKGADHVARRIREVAMAHRIPLVERKPLARSLYELAEVGEEIPPQFYKAVAEILAYVYQLSGKSVA